MGNLLKSAVKVLVLAAQALFVSVTTPNPQNAPVEPIAIREEPVYVELTQPCLTTDPNTICFETERGTVFIYRNSSLILQ